MKNESLKLQSENSRFLSKLNSGKSVYNAFDFEQSYKKRNERLQTLGKYPYILDKPLSPPTRSEYTSWNDNYKTVVVRGRHKGPYAPFMHENFASRKFSSNDSVISSLSHNSQNNVRTLLQPRSPETNAELSCRARRFMRPHHTEGQTSTLSSRINTQLSIYSPKSSQSKRLIESKNVLPYQASIIDFNRTVHYKKGK